MKNFDFQISTEISVLSLLAETIFTIFGMTSVCVCADVFILHDSKTIGPRILKFWI
ncbi:hypothetical protein O3M35_009857 [Rhynocoris fuscipes]|uniref:Uncharacterized protein n=1 Tax=Rhynocoris fuscipes TaxID=488301 RepID=A0AAW1DAC8_9HEMI